MSKVVDRRKNNRNKSAGNRKKFIDRYKRVIKKSIDKIAEKKSIKDFDKDQEVTVQDTMNEPTFRHGKDSGNKEYVLPGNKQYKTGDKVDKPESDSGGRGTKGSNSGEGEDEFTFTLSKDEFLDIYFSDMRLPRYIKEGLKSDKKFIRRKAGYSKEGIPARLNIKKTFEHAIARKISTKAQGKKPRYLDDEDVRYDYYTKKPKLVRQAVMFCLMDVSVSMGETEKMLAKKFFLFLYLFLNKEYTKVDIRFIRHTTEADEVTEDEFFYGKKTGGTIVSSALKKTLNIIKDDYDLDKWNVYVCQASDGDNWQLDDADCVTVLENDLLPKVQYYAYIQTEEPDRIAWKEKYGLADLYTLYTSVAKNNKHLNTARVSHPEEIYPVLRELFKEQT